MKLTLSLAIDSVLGFPALITGKIFNFVSGEAFEFVDATNFEFLFE